MERQDRRRLSSGFIRNRPPDVPSATRLSIGVRVGCRLRPASRVHCRLTLIAALEVLDPLDVPIEEVDDAVGAVGDVSLVGDDEHRRPGRVKLVEEVQNVRLGVGIEVPRRFVGQHDRRVVDQCSRERDPLSLAPR